MTALINQLRILRPLCSIKMSYSQVAGQLDQLLNRVLQQPHDKTARLDFELYLQDNKPSREDLTIIRKRLSSLQAFQFRKNFETILGQHFSDKIQDLIHDIMKGNPEEKVLALRLLFRTQLKSSSHLEYILTQKIDIATESGQNLINILGIYHKLNLPTSHIHNRLYQLSKAPDITTTKELFSILRPEELIQERTLLNYINNLQKVADQFTSVEMVKLVSNVYEFRSIKLIIALKPFVDIAEARAMSSTEQIELRYKIVKIGNKFGLACPKVHNDIIKHPESYLQIIKEGVPSWCIIQYFQKQKISLPDVLFNACVEHKIGELTAESWQRSPTEFLRNLKSFISTQGLIKEPKVARELEKLTLRVINDILIINDKTKQLYKMLSIVSQRLKNKWLMVKLCERLNEVCKPTDFDIVLILTAFTYWGNIKLQLKYNLFEMTNTSEHYMDLPQLYFVIRRIQEPDSAKRTFLINNLKYIKQAYATRHFEMGSYIQGLAFFLEYDAHNQSFLDLMEDRFISRWATEPVKTVDLERINTLCNKYQVLSNNFRALVVSMLTDPDKSNTLLKNYFETVNKKTMLENIKVSD